MFLHAGIGHIFFNMLALWMFGVELERMWGTRAFLKYYVICGVGRGGDNDARVGDPWLAAPALVRHDDDRRVRRRLRRPAGVRVCIFRTGRSTSTRSSRCPAKWMVIVTGAISLMLSLGGGGGVAHTAHLGGLVVGYLYLKGTRIHLLSEIQYRFLKWRINRMRRKFDVYSGGRANDVDRRVH